MGDPAADPEELRGVEKHAAYGVQVMDVLLLDGLCPHFKLGKSYLRSNYFESRALISVRSPQGALLMDRIAKKPNQDGTFTVYLEAQAVAWGLNSSAADALIERLMQVSPPIRWVL
jgi:hypothetical protein